MILKCSYLCICFIFVYSDHGTLSIQSSNVLFIYNFVSDAAVQRFLNSEAQVKEYNEENLTSVGTVFHLKFLPCRLQLNKLDWNKRTVTIQGWCVLKWLIFSRTSFVCSCRMVMETMVLRKLIDVFFVCHHMCNMLHPVW